MEYIEKELKGYEQKQEMDFNKIVIYIGSFSKILFPGIRIGWIAADKKCINRLVTLKRFSDISSSLPEQAQEGVLH